MKSKLALCPICGTEPSLGRAEKSVPGRRGRLFVIFCEGDKHSLSIEGYPKREVVEIWNSMFGKRSALGEGDG